jgi:hypothetical protein
MTQITFQPGRAYKWPRNSSKIYYPRQTIPAVYIGKDKTLQGQGALVSYRGEGILSVQFDAYSTGMAHGWRIMPLKDFRLIGKLEKNNGSNT